MKYPYKQSLISVNINRVQLVVIVLELGVVQSVALGLAQRWLRWAVWAKEINSIKKDREVQISEIDE